MIRTAFIISVLSVCAHAASAQSANRTLVVVRGAELAQRHDAAVNLPVGSVVTVTRVENGKAYLEDGTEKWVAANRLASAAKAIALFSTNLNQDPDDVQLLAARGNLLVEIGRYEEAIADFDQLIHLRPESFRAFNQRGFAQSRLGKTGPALSDFSRAIQLAPGYGIAFYNRGYVLYRHGEFDAAIADFNKALDVLKTDAASLNNRGLSWYAKGEFDRALKDFDDAVKIAPHEPLIYNNRGWTWQRVGEPAKSTADFKIANQLIAQGRTTPSQAPVAARDKYEAVAPIPSDQQAVHAKSARKQFEHIWRDLASGDPTKPPADSVRRGSAAKDVPLAEMLREGVDLKKDPDLLAAVGVFAPEELQRIEAAADREAKEEMLGSGGRKRSNSLGLGPIDAEAIEQLQRTAVHGIYKFESDRLIVRGSTQGNREFTDFLGDAPLQSSELVLQRVGRSVANLTGGSDIDRLQGEWRVEAARNEGAEHDGARRLRLIFRQDRLDVHGEHGALCQFKCLLTPEASPKTFRLSLTYFRGRASDQKRQIQSGDALTADYDVDYKSEPFGVTTSQPASKRSPQLAIAVLVGGLILVALIAKYGGGMVARSGQGSRVSVTARAAPPPQRMHIVLVAILLTALAGSEFLASFQWQPLPFADAVSQFSKVSFFATTLAHLSSWIRDVLFAVIVSFFWMGVLSVDLRSWPARLMRGALLLLVGISFRLVVEFLDSWLNARSSLFVDISPEAAGMIFGAILWCLLGQTTIDWLRSISIDRRPPAGLDWVLLLYFLAFLVYSTWPLDVTIRGADLQRKYSAGQIAFIPFQDATLLARCLVMALFSVPLGMFVATVSTTAHQPVRSKESTLVLGSLLLLAVESFQLLMLGQYATSTDLFAGLAGIVVGMLASIRLHGGWIGFVGRRQNEHSRRYWTRVAPYLFVAVLYAGCLTVSLCTPWNPIADNQLLSVRFSQLFHAPQAILAHQSLSDCLATWTIHAALFAPLGTLWALAVSGPSIPEPVRKILLLFSVLFFVGIALAIEIVQVQLPGKIPSLTEVVAATVGGGLGMLAAYAWLRLRNRARKADLLEALERRTG